jgi:hypothetical protein
MRQRLDRLTAELETLQRRRKEREQSWMEEIEGAAARFAGLESRLDQAEAAVSPNNLRVLVRDLATGIIADRAPRWTQAVLPAVLAALGWTGPPSIAAIFAIRLAARLLRRRIARRTGRAPRRNRRSPSRSKPLHDDYAKQLAGVYALSGRSPIADATLGREYDQELLRAERSSDGALARWARTLRERVANRFYRIHGETPLPAEPPESPNDDQRTQ